MDHQNITVTAHCLCKAHTFTASITRSSLPLAATCCHCDSCRHTTGALYFSTAPWPNRNEDLSSLHRYPFSPNMNYYSCPTCSSQLFCKGNGPEDVPEVLTGVLENAPNLVSYGKHIFVGDTRDGGATVWFSQDMSGDYITRWAGGMNNSEQLPADWPPSPHPPQTMEKVQPEFTPLKCHCGGVNLLLRSAADLPPPTPEDAHTKLPWYVDPTTRRYLANTDGCNSCRLTFGVDLAQWTFAGLDHIHFADAERLKLPGTISELRDALLATADSDKRDGRLGSLGLYQSSSDVERYFCKKCAAGVFYAVHDEGRMDMVDVAVGILRHPDGARAEGLLAWNYGVVGWMEDTEGGWREGLVRGAMEDSERWRVGRGYPKCWRRVLKEGGDLDPAE